MDERAPDTSGSSSGSGSDMRYMAAIVFLGLVVVMIAIWVYTRYIRPTRSMVVPKTDRLLDATRETRINFMAPDMRNGNNYTVSLWMYVSNHSENVSGDRHVLNMGPINLIMEGSTPTLQLSGSTFTFKEILPTRRWVHVAVVVTDHVGYECHLYLDGDLVDRKGISSTEVGSMNALTKPFAYAEIGSRGGSLVGFEGIITRVTVANYDRGQREIRAEYASGPMSGFARYGIGWGLRSPVYKVG